MACHTCDWSRFFGSRILGLSLGFYSFPGNYFSFETPCNFNLAKMAVLYFSVFKVHSNHKFKINQCTFVLFVTIICFFNHIFCDTTCNGLPCQNGICKQNDTVCECFEGWSGPSCTHCSGRIRLESLDNYSEISVNSRSRVKLSTTKTLPSLSAFVSAQARR